MTTARTTGPKWTRATIEYSKDKYVVQNGLLYEYYNITCRPLDKQKRFQKIKISPSVLQPGIAMVYGKMFNVSLRDLFRRRIDVTAVRPNEQQTTSITSIATKSKRDDGIKVVISENKSGSSSSDWDQVSEDANMAWENQVGALLQTLHTKEGEDWEIKDATQSGPVNEDSTVQDPNADT